MQHVLVVFGPGHQEIHWTNEDIIEDGDLLPPHAQILKNYLVFCYALAERRRVGTKKSSVDEKRRRKRKEEKKKRG